MSEFSGQKLTWVDWPLLAQSGRSLVRRSHLRPASQLAVGVSRLRFTTSAQRVAGQPVNPRLAIFSVKKLLPLGHGGDRLVYPEAALLKIVSK